jgi:hypothetical protein
MPQTWQTDIADLKMKIMRAEKFARRSGDRSEVDDLRRQYLEAKIEAYVERVMAEAPPLTLELVHNKVRHPPEEAKRRAELGKARSTPGTVELCSNCVQKDDHERGLPLRGRLAAHSLIVCCRQTLVAPT